MTNETILHYPWTPSYRPKAYELVENCEFIPKGCTYGRIIFSTYVPMVYIDQPYVTIRNCTFGCTREYGQKMRRLQIKRLEAMRHET